MRVEVFKGNPPIPYAESVAPGHPDMVANIAADHYVDKAIEHSMRIGGKPRVSLEVTVKAGVEADGENLDVFSPEMQEMVKKHGLVVVTGEVTLPVGVNLPFKSTIVEGIRAAGYDDPNYPFSPVPETVLVAVNKQSRAIGDEVSRGKASDQGGIIGFATQGPRYLPLAVEIAQSLTIRHFELFKEGRHGIRPDGKAQISLRQKWVNGRLVPIGIENLTVAVAHSPEMNLKELQEFLLREQINPVLDRYNLQLSEDTQLVINGFGPWTGFYGPVIDSGAVNRKIIAQTYGLAARHGGGGLSGKDPTKIDRSGAMFARNIALSLVAGGLVNTCEVMVTYSMGHPKPHIIRINTLGSNKPGWSDEKIIKLVEEKFSWTVPEMIERLKLWQPIYKRTNFDGVFGESDYPWEQPTELVLIKEL